MFSCEAMAIRMAMKKIWMISGQGIGPRNFVLISSIGVGKES